MMAMKIHSPVVDGSGVVVLHRVLEAHFEQYRVTALKPSWGLLPQLTGLMPSAESDVTHTHPELGPWVAHRGSRLVATFHNYYLDDFYCRHAGFLRRTYYRKILAPAINETVKVADRLTAVSKFTADLVLRHHDVGHKLEVVRNGINTDLFRPSDDAKREDSVRILFSGNPSPRKGLADLIALSEALPTHAVLQFTSGTRDSSVSSLPTSSRVVAIPRRPHAEMPSLYQQADILFLPSLREGLSLALLEGAASGLPILAADTSSMPEVVDHGQGGFLFKPGDRDSMRQYLGRLVSDAQLRADMGAYNREKCLKEFTSSRMVKEYAQVFDGLQS